ncbi:MAG: hypothetical protein LBB93_06595 [Elusimicrobiota bacterium]|jgi:hypothetical protein|nr:hypothetical protein [Elusimicrobiota bacterium]
MTTFLLDKKIGSKKAQLLDYYRNRATELIAEVKQLYGDSEYKRRASAVNSGLIKVKNNLIKSLEQKAKKENWKPEETLSGILMITYTNYIVMMESRNDVWSYEYMAFSRRIGELWDPFCQLCWEYPVNPNINYFVPPLFKDVKEKLSNEINDLIEKLKISKQEKEKLKKYYRKVWILVTSGEIKLELDLHFEDGKKQYVVDFKSGFSSNEKGNTNRLLLVASVYKILEEGHQCLLFVRSAEEKNNHYLQTLKKSGFWTVYCGQETYDQIKQFTGFDLPSWLKTNVDWADDFDAKMYKHLKNINLIQYLEW